MVRMLGFELGLAYTAEVRRSDVRTRPRGLIDQHDDDRVDVPVVRVNSSLRSGLYFPSFELVARVVMEDADPLTGHIQEHLKQIVTFASTTHAESGGCVTAMSGSLTSGSLEAPADLGRGAPLR